MKRKLDALEDIIESISKFRPEKTLNILDQDRLGHDGSHSIEKDRKHVSRIIVTSIASSGGEGLAGGASREKVHLVRESSIVYGISIRMQNEVRIYT
jgi:hypothetical protein